MELFELWVAVTTDFVSTTILVGAGGPLRKQLNTSLLALLSTVLFFFGSLSVGFAVGDDRPSRSELNAFDSVEWFVTRDDVFGLFELVCQLKEKNN